MLQSNMTAWSDASCRVRICRITSNFPANRMAAAAHGNPDTVTGPEGNVNDYDIRGRKTAETDPNGNTTSYGYNILDQLIGVTYPALTAYSLPTGSTRTETMSYDPKGNLLTKTDRLGLTLTYTYTARDQVATVTRSAGGTKTFGYDENGNLTAESDWKGIATAHGYDALNRRTSTTNRLGHAMAMGYDANDNLTSRTDFEGHVTTYVYDDLNRPTEIHRPDLNGQAVVTLRTYYDEADPDKNLATETDAEGHTSTYAYNGRYLRTGRTNALNDTYTWAYDDAGNLESETDEEGIPTSCTYDAQNRRTDTHRASVRVAHNQYDAAGNLRFVTDANNHISETRYDQWNRAYLTIDAEGHQSLAHLDGGGNKVFEQDANGRQRTWAYDTRGLLEKYTDAEGAETGYTYDVNGNPETVTYANNAVTRTTYDAQDRELTVTQAYGQSEARTREIVSRDRNGNPTEEKDFNGNSTHYAYNDLNLVETVTDAAGNAAVKTYYRTGKLKTEQNRRGHETVEVTTGYDENNNIVSVIEAKIDESNAGFTDETVNTYDNFDRLETGTQRGLLTSYTYDANGNCIGVTTPAGTTVYTYDERNRLETAVADGTTTYTYRDDGLKQSVTYPNGTRAAYTYTAADRIETITHSRTSDGSVISSYSYTYDANVNRTQQIELQDGVGEITTYNYDDLDRLTDFTVAGADTTVTAYTYEAYNRKTETVTENGTVTGQRSYTYDATDWLTSISDTTDTANPYTIAYTYDNNGNTLEKSNSSLTNQDQTFAYDALNRLVQTRQGPAGSQTTVGRYDYNAAGLRIRHRLSERGDVDYFYDDNAVIEEHNATDDSLLAHYRYADRLISLDTGAGKQYYHHDALGSTVNLTTTAAAVQVSYRLDPWGHIRDQVGTSVNRQIFTGQEHDENTGLIYFGARYYDPDTGRFITQDIYLGELGTPPSLHRYLYAYSNPLVYIDLFGYASNRELMGLDDKSVDQSLAEDPSLKNVLWLTAKGTAYKAWNLLTGGFVERQDERQEKLDRGEISNKEFWTGTGIDTGVSIGSQFVGGAVGGKVAGAVGGRVTGAMLGGAVMGGLSNTAEQVGQMATYHLTEARLGQKEFDLRQAVMSTAMGAALGGGLAAGQKLAQEAMPVLRQNVSQALKQLPKMTKEIPTGLKDAGQKIFAKGRSILARTPLSNETGSVGSNIASKSLATNADEAVFWSGIRNSDTAAAKWVAQNGGSTLETTLANRGIKLPTWDASNPASVAAWRQASKEFAAGASGNVRVLQSDAVRIKSIWAEVEFPALKANPNVTAIRAVNAKTGVETLLWSR
jgi:RHS repeat-associated protein